jgi:hypothetical protein
MFPEASHVTPTQGKQGSLAAVQPVDFVHAAPLVAKNKTSSA